MSTDIVDKELKALRNARWEKAFKNVNEKTECALEDPVTDRNRKATIVIERKLSFCHYLAVQLLF